MNNETIQSNQGPDSNQTLNEAASSRLKPFLKLLRAFGIKKSFILALIAVMAGAVFYYKGIFIAASVDGHWISRMALISQLEKQSGKQSLDMLINKQLIINEAEKKNIKVSDSEIEAEISKLESQITQQGNTIENLLEADGITMEDLVQEVRIQKFAEKLLADKVTVTDEEVQQYIKTNKITLDRDKAKADEQRSQLRDQLQKTKFSVELGSWLNSARAQAKINRY